MKYGLKYIIKLLLKGFGILVSLILLLFVVFYFENSAIDDSLLPARNPDEVFSDTHFQDSVLQFTEKGEYFLMVKKNMLNT